MCKPLITLLSAVFIADEEQPKPQTLLFSATMPEWVHKTAKKYMRDDVKLVDLVGRDRMQTSTTVQVQQICFIYMVIHVIYIVIDELN